ncbi:MAG: hypothetical protein ACOH2K_09615 [Burkholderiaceae bacterium]
MIFEKIAQIRTRIEEIKTERDTVAAQRRSRKQIGAHIEATVRHWSNEADKLGRTNAARAAAGLPVAFLTVHAHGMTASGPVSLAVDLGPLAVMLLGADAVVDAVSRSLSTVPEGDMPPVRTRKLQDLAEALHVAQIEEEALIRNAEQTGEIIPYRADADPAYTLTHMEPQ